MEASSIITFTEFCERVLPLLLDHTVERVDKETTLGKVTAYWCGDVLRIDIKPQPSIETLSL